MCELTHPLWRIVARAAKAKPGQVWAIVCALREADGPRSSAPAILSEALGWPLAAIMMIQRALEANGVTCDGQLAEEWRRSARSTNPAGSAERMRRLRERRKLAALGLIPSPASPGVTCDGVTVAASPVTAGLSAAPNGAGNLSPKSAETRHLVVIAGSDAPRDGETSPASPVPASRLEEKIDNPDFKISSVVQSLREADASDERALPLGAIKRERWLNRRIQQGASMLSAREYQDLCDAITPNDYKGFVERKVPLPLKARASLETLDKRIRAGEQRVREERDASQREILLPLPGGKAPALLVDEEEDMLGSADLAVG